MIDATTMATWIKDIRAHASKNYNVDGWDFVVESYDDSDMVDDIGDAKTYEEAMRRIAEVVRMCNGRRAEVQAEAGPAWEEEQVGGWDDEGGAW